MLYQGPERNFRKCYFLTRCLLGPTTNHYGCHYQPALLFCLMTLTSQRRKRHRETCFPRAPVLTFSSNACVWLRLLYYYPFLPLTAVSSADSKRRSAQEQRLLTIVEEAQQMPEAFGARRRSAPCSCLCPPGAEDPVGGGSREEPSAFSATF